MRLLVKLSTLKSFRISNIKILFVCNQKVPLKADLMAQNRSIEHSRICLDTPLVKNLRQSRRLEKVNRSKRVNFVPPKGGNAFNKPNNLRH
jgi:hypothetical protein